ncbi:hypothetical protein RR46_04146 [Papilio xuthus]|uniref:Uncharacterized protein n=1 Tax=Papilio xuthus TaxID=66420 RepID=A0A194QJD3_PAPXU|nr:hypothetical protein RR46_04146 [Papilio xuthus]
MSEEHDKDCTNSDEQSNEKQCNTSENVEKLTEVIDSTEEPKSGNISEDQTSAIETSQSDLNENEDLCHKYVEAAKAISWTVEGSEFKISWKLPEGSTTGEDYIGLCYKAKFVRYIMDHLLRTPGSSHYNQVLANLNMEAECNHVPPTPTCARAGRAHRAPQID